MKQLGAYLSLVRFSHSVFALPFALSGAWLAAGGRPPLARLAWIVACAVCARTAAMAFNRLVDREIDAENPRTRGRELPSGRISTSGAGALVAIASAGFVACAFQLNALCGWLALPVLAVLFAYSYFKRFSVAAHAVLGLSLGLAPLGAWLAVRGSFDGLLAPVLWLAGAVVTWVAGFDLIYACQDAEFDARRRLYSFPGRYGIRASLGLSRALHVATVACLALVGLTAGLDWIYAASVALVALLLWWEHRLVSPDDLSRVNMAFFTVNGWVGIGLFAGLALDRAVLGS